MKIGLSSESTLIPCPHSLSCASQESASNAIFSPQKRGGVVSPSHMNLGELPELPDVGEGPLMMELKPSLGQPLVLDIVRIIRLDILLKMRVAALQRAVDDTARVNDQNPVLEH